MSYQSPSYKQGFASPQTGGIKYPSLWRGCVGAWNPGLGPTGLVLRDWGPSGRHGAITAASTFGWYIQSGHYTLRASTSWINSVVDAGSRLGYTTNFSVMAWAQPNATTGFQQIAGERDVGTRNWQLRTNSGKLSVLFSSGSVDAPANMSTAAPSCVGFTFSNGNVELIENGKSVGTTTGAVIGTNTLPFQIGNNAIGHYWRGSIAEVRLYSRVLSRREWSILSMRPGIAYEQKRRVIYSIPEEVAASTTEAIIIRRKSNVTPSYKSGFARSASESEYPQLRRELRLGISPQLGHTGMRVREHSAWRDQVNLDPTYKPAWSINSGYMGLEFDGADTFAKSVSTRNIYTAATQVTWSVWANPRTAGEGNNGRVFQSRVGTDVANMFTNSVGRWTATIGASTVSTALSVVTYNTLQHVAMVWDGANCQMYLNGKATGSAVSFAGPLTVDANALMIGNNTSGGRERTFDGWIFDVSLYNRALTTNEIRLLARRPGIAYEQKRRVIYSIPEEVAASTTEAIIIRRKSNVTPSYKQGFAPRDGRAAHENLWKGCVGAWHPGLGPSGLTLRDWSGYRRHGTLVGMDPATDWVVSGGKHALDFDGDDDFIEFGSIAATSPLALSGGRMSISAWIRPVLTGDDFQRIIDKSTAGNATNGYILYLNQTTWKIAFTADNAVSQTIANVAPAANTWSHIGVSKADGVAAKIYLNGKETGYDSTDTTNIPAAAAGMRFGSWNHSTVREYKGQIAEIGMWSRVLTPNEFRLLARRPGIAYELAPRCSYASPSTTNRRRRLLIGA